MAIDKERIKKKLNNLRNSGGKSNNLWKPDEGDQIIRLVPYRWDKDFPFIELYFHYELPGQPNYLSPISFDDVETFPGPDEQAGQYVDREDPIADFANEVRREKGQKGYEMWKTLFPKRRTFAPVVVRGEEDQGVRFWGFGKTIFEELLAKFNDEDWGDLSDPHEGRDIKVTYIPRAQSDTNFPKTKVDPKPVTSPLAEDKDQLREFFDSQVPITDVFDVPTEEDLQNALEDYLQGEDEDDEEDESPTASSSDSGGEESTDTAEFEEEFDEMFD